MRRTLELRLARGHIRIEPLDRAAAGPLEQRGNQRVEQARDPRRDHRRAEPRSDAEMFGITLADAARVRAMYTHPDFVRRGVGRLILGLCEAAAAAEGFGWVELMSTMAGEPLYRACGYREIERTAAPTAAGVDVPLVRMGKPL